jgi:hypothetical protein
VCRIRSAKPGAHGFNVSETARTRRTLPTGRIKMLSGCPMTKKRRIRVGWAMSNRRVLEVFLKQFFVVFDLEKTVFVVFNAIFNKKCFWCGKNCFKF